jgi:dihydrolipoamide dehydrogenase
MSNEQQAADVVVIGGGPGGYVAAIRAAQLGLDTVCVELEQTLGGTCVNVGCIPSKALLQDSEHFEFARLHAHEHGIRFSDLRVDLHQMLKRKDDVVGQNTRGIEFLFRKHKVRWVRGFGQLLTGNVVDVTDSDGGNQKIRAKHVIIATGSTPIELPFLRFDEQRIVSNIGALALPEVPTHLVVIGGGVIGLELGSVWRRLGAKVSVVEMMPGTCRAWMKRSSARRTAPSAGRASNATPRPRSLGRRCSRTASSSPSSAMASRATSRRAMSSWRWGGDLP